MTKTGNGNRTKPVLVKHIENRYNKGTANEKEFSEMRYYEVIAKCGHVGKGKYVLITFACVAENGKEAAAKARACARVKHHHKDAIRNVREVLFEEYIKLKAENDADPYLHCKNRQEQNKIPGFEERIIPDPVEEKMHKKASPLRHERVVRREAEMVAEMQAYFREGVAA